MVTPGGEVAFVGRMIEESMQLRSGIRWYTSMVLAPPPPPPKLHLLSCVSTTDLGA